jgi:hypothetical protein
LPFLGKRFYTKKFRLRKMSNYMGIKSLPLKKLRRMEKGTQA